MALIDRSTNLKILIALADVGQASQLQRDLDCLGHRVHLCQGLDQSVGLLRRWQPDLIVTEETFERCRPESGLRLAESCRSTEDQINGWPGTRILVLVPVADWDRVARARQTGAHVVVKKPDFAAAIRYVQTIADNLATDRQLGPVLVGLHRFAGDTPHPKCANCEWIGASISYGSSETEIALTPVRMALLNVLLFRRRNQSPRAIEEICRESNFLSKVLRGHSLRESAIKMEVTRLRHNIGQALQAIGTPYTGSHFLPIPAHGLKAYGLAGTRRLVHIANS